MYVCTCSMHRCVNARVGKKACKLIYQIAILECVHEVCYEDFFLNQFTHVVQL